MAEHAQNLEVLPHGFFDFEGRIGRARYALITLLHLCIGLVVFAAAAPKSLSSEILAGALVSLPFVPSTIKRFHDVDRSGAWVWGLLIPFLNILLALRLLLQPGTPGPNKFGSRAKSGPKSQSPDLMTRWWSIQRPTRGVVFVAVMWMVCFFLFVEEPTHQPKLLFGVPLALVIGFWLLRRFVMEEAKPLPIEEPALTAPTLSPPEGNPTPSKVSDMRPAEREAAMNALINKMK
jgi:uncharacterized membrane protein YhaH (DUF805 family)